MMHIQLTEMPAYEILASSLPVNVFELFTRVQQLGGFDAVSEKKLWKLLYDEMSGSTTSSSSAANPPQNAQSFSSIMKRHYERFDFLFHLFLGRVGGLVVFCSWL